MIHLKTAALAALVALGGLSCAQGTNTTTTNVTLPAPVLVDLGSGVVGGLHRPAVIGPKAGIAVFVMHAEADYLDFPACTELPARGYTVFCANNYASKAGWATDVDFDLLMQSVALGVDYLRGLSEINRVVVFGHSGGGDMMSAYQNIAENGLAACQGSEKIYPCSDDLADLPAADGIMLIDSNYGAASMVLLSLNPAIVNESSGLDIDPALDLYNTANGFVNGTVSGAVSNYTAKFTKAFQSGVAARMNRLIIFAENQLRDIEAGNGSFTDDEDMYVVDADYGIQNNKFFAQDTRFLSRTAHPWPLLHKNGSATIQIVPTVRVPANWESYADSYTNGAVKTTIVNFLQSFALRVGDDFGYNETDFTGVDWASSHMIPIAAAAGIHVPLLTMGMTGHWEFLNAEKIHLNSVSNDSSIAFVEGASHVLTTCTQCESYPGEYGDTETTAFDYMDGWLGKKGRFL